MQEEAAIVPEKTPFYATKWWSAAALYMVCVGCTFIWFDAFGTLSNFGVIQKESLVPESYRRLFDDAGDNLADLSQGELFGRTCQPIEDLQKTNRALIGHL